MKTAYFLQPEGQVALSPDQVLPQASLICQGCVAKAKGFLGHSSAEYPQADGGMDMGFSAMTDAQPRDLLDKAALLLMRLQVAPPGVLCTCGTGPHPIPSALGCVSVDRTSDQRTHYPLWLRRRRHSCRQSQRTRGTRQRASVRFIGTHPLLPAP